MKKTFLSFLLGVMAFSAPIYVSAQKAKPFKLNGYVSEGLHDVKYLLTVSDDDYNIVGVPDTIDVDMKTRKFSFTRKITDPRNVKLQAIFDDGSICGAYMMFIIIPGETANLTVKNGTFTLDGKNNFYSKWSKVDNTFTPQQMDIMHVSEESDSLYEAYKPLFEEYEKASAKLTAVNEEYDAKRRALDDFAKKLAEENKDDAATILYIGDAGYVSYSELNDIAGDAVKKGSLGAMFNKLVAKEKAVNEERIARQARIEANKALTVEGNKFLDFEVEYDGKVQKLSDYVGRGKYVIVDFWASWCGPCRGEIPYLKKVWEKYKGEDFEVVGVATWDEPERTKKAIEELGIEYPQIMNAQNVGSEVYGVSGIPEIILFGPDGTIIKRGLRGRQIESIVKEKLGR